MARAYKDMVALMERASECHAPLPVASGALQTYKMALGKGYGDEAKGAMIKVWEEVMGVTARHSSAAARWTDSARRARKCCSC